MKKKQVEMNPEALYQMKRNHYLVDLASVWESVKRSKNREETIAHWAELAYVLPEIVEQHYQQLFDLGICRHDGTIDQLAKRYIRNEIGKTIKRK